jgi:hypothetical protein
MYQNPFRLQKFLPPQSVGAILHLVKISDRPLAAARIGLMAPDAIFFYFQQDKLLAARA